MVSKSADPLTRDRGFESGSLHRRVRLSQEVTRRGREARHAVKRLRAITPAVMPPDIMYLRNAQHRELYLSGLRLAAGEAA